MVNRFFKIAGILSVAACFTLFGAYVYADQDGGLKKNATQLEEQGLGDAQRSEKPGTPTQKQEPGDLILDTNVLLIPESTNDVVGMYDPFDGTYLGDLIPGHIDFSTPVNAVPGPDGNIYVSDQVADAVFVFDSDGNYLFTYADATDGLNNIRGIDFRDGHLFVTSGDDYVAEFDGPHSRLADFIADGSDPFDIYFLEDGRALLADIQGTLDNVRLYNADGTLDGELFSVSFPEQIQGDPLAPGAYLNASFSDNQVTDFELDGTITQTTAFDGGRGVYRLGNGNLLLTNGDGIFEVEPGTGAIVEQENAGSGRFIEPYTIPEASVPTLSEWGLIILALLLVLSGTIAVVRRRKAATAART